MKYLLFFLALGCSLAAGAREYLYEVGPFDQLSSLGNLNIVYKSMPDSVGKAVYDSESDFSNALEISNNNGKLQIREVPDHGLGALPTLRVYSAYVSSVKTEGKGTTEVFLTNPTPTFSARLVGNGKIICEGINSTNVKATLATGNGSLIMRGKCTEAKYELMGTGLIQADGLAATRIKCTAIGTGSIGCDATESLDVRGIGTTKIYYLGDPKIKKTGGASLHHMVFSEEVIADPKEESFEDSQEVTIVEASEETIGEEAEEVTIFEAEEETVTEEENKIMTE